MRIAVISIVLLAALAVPAQADPLPVVFPPDLPAETIVFGFESQPDGLTIGPGGKLIMSQGGYTVEISRAGGSLEIVDLSLWNEFAVPGGVPTSWGTRSLSPFVDNGFVTGDPILFEVTAVPTGMAVLWLGIEAGDFGPSDHDWGAFGGKNFELDNSAASGTTDFFSTVFLGSIHNAWPHAPGAPRDPSNAPSGLDSTTGHGGAEGQRNSLFWDNFTIHAVDIDDLPVSVVAPAFADSSDPLGGTGGIPSTPPPPPIPEPGSLVLLGGAVAAIALLRRRR